MSNIHNKIFLVVTHKCVSEGQQLLFSLNDTGWYFSEFPLLQLQKARTQEKRAWQQAPETHLDDFWSLKQLMKQKASV